MGADDICCSHASWSAELISPSNLCSSAWLEAEPCADAAVDMARAEAKAGQIDRAVLDLAEAIVLDGREGSRFDAVVTDVDERGARIQVCDPAVIARVDGKGAEPGDRISVVLEGVDVAQRRVAFQRVE